MPKRRVSPPQLPPDHPDARYSPAVQRALRVLRDPDGTGTTKVSVGFVGHMNPVRCLKPIPASHQMFCTLLTGHAPPCDAQRRTPSKEPEEEPLG